MWVEAHLYCGASRSDDCVSASSEVLILHFIWLGSHGTILCLDDSSKYFTMNITAVNQSIVCQEYSCPGRSVSLSVYVILYVAAASVSLLTVCGNLLVIISVSHFKQLHTPANILILSLAVSDLLVGVFVMPFHLSWLIESCWISGPVMCSVFSFVTFQATSVSVHTVALIAVDRFLALSSPFLYSPVETLQANFSVYMNTQIKQN